MKVPLQIEYNTKLSKIYHQWISQPNTGTFRLKYDLRRCIAEYKNQYQSSSAIHEVLKRCQY